MDSVVVIKVISMLLYPLGLAGLFVVTGFLLRLLSWTSGGSWLAEADRQRTGPEEGAECPSGEYLRAQRK